jgi:hypothetical protein
MDLEVYLSHVATFFRECDLLYRSVHYTEGKNSGHISKAYDTYMKFYMHLDPY